MPKEKNISKELHKAMGLVFKMAKKSYIKSYGMKAWKEKEKELNEKIEVEMEEGVNIDIAYLKKVAVELLEVLVKYDLLNGNGILALEMTKNTLQENNIQESFEEEYKDILKKKKRGK